MSDEGVTQVPTVFSSKERAALVAKALSEAARRARFSSKRQRLVGGASLRARRVERLRRLLMIASFVCIVAVPSVIAAVYYGSMASDQYASEARFTVRGGLPTGLDAIGTLTGAPSIMIIQDTQVIMNYMQSRAIVEDLQKRIHLTRLFQGSDIDYFSRLGMHKPIEKVVKYWKRQLELSVQMPAGIVVFTVRAFTPEDAVTIAKAALESSELLVNQMNDQMRRDVLDLAEREHQRAQDNLAAARATLEKARNDEGMLSATEASTALTDLLSDIRGQMIKLQQEYDSQRRFVRADSPQLRTLQTKIDAAKQEMDKLQATMTGTKPGPDGPLLSGSMSRLDYALLNNTIMEKIYAGAQAAVEHATVASETKLMYINTFVQPVAAEQSKFPLRLVNVVIIVTMSLAAWAVVLGVFSLLRRGR